MTAAMIADTTDFVIAGGGPAGSIAAILLARAGARVALVDAGGRGEWIEGAGQRLVAALRAQGLAAEGLGPLVERRVSWGALTGSPNREHALARPAFDAGLRTQAADEGVAVLTAPINKLRPGALDLSDGRTLSAGLVFDARGRRASRGDGRERGAPTISIAAPTAPGPQDAKVVALDDGWLWRIATARASWTQISVDAEAARDPGAVWWRMTGKPLPASPLIRASELRLNAATLDADMPRLGDAAVAMDPLSGHGLFWAMSSALMAVPLARALLGSQTVLARRFYRDRVVGTYERQARVGRDFYRAANLTGPFWSARSRAGDDIPAEPPIPTAPYFERRVVVRDARLAEADVLVTPRDPEGAAFVCGVEIAPLLARLGPDPVSDRAVFAARALPDAPPETAARIFDWLAERGITTASAIQHKEVIT